MRCSPHRTAKDILDHAGSLGIPCEVTTLAMQEIERADEVFLTNSGYGILPVGAIDDMSFRTGPITERLLKGLCRNVYF